ncbi:MAG: hypothetical protein HYV63_14295 [Candidatus Schekmanbacteria bacterium]|nr:hypothetical protein [Candidatus Schekmanbacteria bacterium]
MNDTAWDSPAIGAGGKERTEDQDGEELEILDAGVSVRISPGGELTLTYSVNGSTVYRRGFDLAALAPGGARVEILSGLQYLGELVLELKDTLVLDMRLDAFARKCRGLATPHLRSELRAELLAITGALPALTSSPATAPRHQPLLRKCRTILTDFGFTDATELAGLVIAVVESDPATADLVREVVRETTARVAVFPTADAFLSWAAENSFDMLYTNVSRPGLPDELDGLDLIKLLKGARNVVEELGAHRGPATSAAEVFERYEVNALYKPFEYRVLRVAICRVFANFDHYLAFRDRVRAIPVVVCTGFDRGARISAICRECSAAYIKKPFDTGFLSDYVVALLTQRVVENRTV